MTTQLIAFVPIPQTRMSLHPGRMTPASGFGMHLLSRLKLTLRLMRRACGQSPTTNLEID